MKSNEQLRKEFEEQTGNKAIVFPACHGETGYASWEYQLWLEQKLLEEYARQFRSPDMAEALTSEELGELIDKHIGGMFGGLEMASIDHFKQTGKINGSFRLRLISLMKFYEFKLKDKALSSSGSGWVKVEDGLPEVLETVWISNGKGWTTLGCRSGYQQGDDGELIWCWCATNGTIYEEDGKIVAECEEDDWDVRHWRPLPAPPGE